MTVVETGFQNELPSESPLTSISGSLILNLFLKFFAAVFVFGMVFFAGSGSKDSQQVMSGLDRSSANIVKPNDSDSLTQKNDIEIEKITPGLGLFKNEVVETTTTTLEPEAINIVEPALTVQLSRPQLKPLPPKLQISKVEIHPTDSSIKAVVFLKTCPLPTEPISIQLVNPDNRVTTAVVEKGCVAELIGTVNDLKADTKYYVQIAYGSGAVFETEASTCKPGNVC